MKIEIKGKPGWDDAKNAITVPVKGIGGYAIIPVTKEQQKTLAQVEGTVTSVVVTLELDNIAPSKKGQQ